MSAGEVVFDYCYFEECNADKGGAIFVSGSAVVRLNGFNGINPNLGGNPCWFYDCLAVNDGGAIYNQGSLYINSGYFNDNEAFSGNGGAVASTGYVTGAEAWFKENTASGLGGGLYMNTSSKTASGFTGGINVLFYNNTAATGGGIAVEGGTLVLDSSTIPQQINLQGNVATSNGGGLYVSGGTVTASDVLIDSDQAPVDPATMKPKGSGIDIGATGTVNTTACYFNGATGVRNGGTWTDSKSGGYIME